MKELAKESLSVVTQSSELRSSFLQIRVIAI